tara:strand:- start:24 stop:539 length:516 start_codon:yes stop_codon:yes gene_type:complete
MPRVVVKKHIEDSLDNAQRLFDRELLNVTSKSYISLNYQIPKLAVLELGAWVEETQDALVLRCLRKQRVGVVELGEFKDFAVDPNSSLTYHAFRRMLMFSLGYSELLSLEKRLGSSNKQVLASKLGSLRTIRNEFAHTHRPSVAAVNTPQFIKNNYFNEIYRIFRRIEVLL